jgi:DNA-binding transcriptional LysR family regulator
MNKSNIYKLDGDILRTFLIILEETSVSKAAVRLNVTQPAVSHALTKLRQTLDDPLFVRSGQGLTPTQTAISLKEPIQQVLDGLMKLTDQRPFNSKTEEMHFVVAANDLQRELFFPKLWREARLEDIRLSLEFIPSGIPSISLLRDARCQIILTPFPPDAPDVFQRRLFSSDMMCFYDANMRDAPTSWGEYINAEHISVRFLGGNDTNEALRGIDKSEIREPTITVSNFNAIPSFIKGSNLISTEISAMHIGPLKELSMAPLPFKSEKVSLYLVWHERSNNDPAHNWIRRRIEKIAAKKLQHISARPVAGQ